MLKQLTILIAFFTLPLATFACEVFSVDVRVQPRPNPDSLNHTFDVQIKVLLDDSCDFASQTHRFYVWTQCGEHYTETATITNSRAISPSEFSCINTSQLSDTALREFTLTGTFTLNNSHCSAIRTYFEYGQQTFYNIEDYDSVAVPVAGWVDLNGTLGDTLGHPTSNAPHLPDTTIGLISACLGKTKTISPMVSDPNEPWKDSLYIELKNVSWIDTTSDSFPIIKKRDFLGYYNKAYPIPSNSYSISKHRRINFTPTDTGLFALPTYSVEYTWDHTFQSWFIKYRTYRLIPLFVSDQCTPSNQEAFAKDTIPFNCRAGKLYIPLQGMAHPGSISSDGSDLKFHNPNGYPALITAARAKDFNSSYTDTLEVDISFWFDGYYQVQLLRGADGNRLIDDCGYEMAGNNWITLNVKNCSGMNVSEAEVHQKLELYPNPTKGFFTITSPTHPISSLKIYTITGQLTVALNDLSEEELKVAVNDKWKGLHLIQIETENGRTFSQKVIFE